MRPDPGLERRFHLSALPGCIRAERGDRAAIHPLGAMPPAEIEGEHRAKRILGTCLYRVRPPPRGGLECAAGRLRREVLLRRELLVERALG